MSDIFVQQLEVKFNRAIYSMLITGGLPGSFEILAWYRPAPREMMRPFGEQSKHPTAEAALDSVLSKIANGSGFKADPLDRVITYGTEWLDVPALQAVFKTNSMKPIIDHR